MHNNFALKILVKNILLDFYHTLDDLGLNDQEKDLYQRIYLYLSPTEGFITNESLHKISNKTYSNKKKILKKLVEKKVITITKKKNPLINNFRLHRYITCNVSLNFKLLDQY